jgi:hypothetical protein
MDKMKPLTIIAVYRSQSGSLDQLVSWFCCIIEKINKHGKGIVILRDLNISMMDNGSHHNQLLDISNIYNLVSTINVTNRVTDSTAFAKDQIMTDPPEHYYQDDDIHSLLSC